MRKRGEAAIQRLLGHKVKAPGRKPTKTYSKPEEIPPAQFPTCWLDRRKADGRSALDDMMESYRQFCAYLGLRIERATGSPTIDHFVPKSRDWRLVYEWSNYRLAAACVNGAKGTREVVDPFRVGHGWFELNLETFLVRQGPDAPKAEFTRIAETLKIQNLRQCVAQRGEFIALYRAGDISLTELERYAPFIASEVRQQERFLGH